MRKRLTRAVLEGLHPGECAYDPTAPGFFAERGAKGVALRVKADLRRPGARPRGLKATLGHWPALGLDEARPLAMKWLATVKAGEDPRVPAVGADGLTVEQAYAEHARGAVKRKGAGAARNCNLMKERLERYCPDWLDRPLASITPLEARQRHDAIMAKVKAGARIEGADGARSANQVLRDLRAVWNRAAKVQRDLGPAPTDAVEWAKEHNEHSIIEWSDLPAWKAATEKLRAARRTMHHVGLFSGLRPGNLVSIRRDWIDLRRRVVCFPADVMKGGKAFDLPLSDALIRLLKEALQIAEANFRDAPWLFPTRDRAGHVVATRVWKEKKDLLGKTGHALRHTYSAAVILAGVSEVSRELLLAHKLGGIRGRYVDDRALWSQLLADQNKVSRKLLQLFTEA